MAEPAFGDELSAGFLRRHPGEIRDEGLVRNKAVYLALGVAADGTKDIVGLWIETTEGAKFWLKVMNDLKVRGVEDILIAVAVKLAQTA
jgi:transposase-like protein